MIVKANKKLEKSVFKFTDGFIDDYWRVTCPKCKGWATWRAYLSNNKERLYLMCSDCQAMFITREDKKKQFKKSKE